MNKYVEYSSFKDTSRVARIPKLAELGVPRKYLLSRKLARMQFRCLGPRSLQIDFKLRRIPSSLLKLNFWNIYDNEITTWATFIIDPVHVRIKRHGSVSRTETVPCIFTNTRD